MHAFRAWSAVVVTLAACGGVAREPTGAPDGGDPQPDSGGSSDDGAARGCGGLSGETCPEGQYCFYSIAQACGAADATGVCTPRAKGCSLIYQPVCGCDGKTYGNGCEAAMNGLSVARDGACEGPDAAVCQEGETKKIDCNKCTCRDGQWGCTIVACPPPVVGQPCTERDKTCAANEYCNYPSEPTCSRSGAAGVCTPRPDGCGDIAARVCGCNMRQYINACEAARAGTGVYGPAPCPPDAR